MLAVAKFVLLLPYRIPILLLFKSGAMDIKVSCLNGINVKYSTFHG